MSLTVPMAGSTAGRAAVQQVEDSPVPQALGQLAQTMLTVGTRLETDRLDREAARFQVDLTRDMNNLALELDQIGDPDELARAWEQGSQQLRQRYFQGQTEDGRPIVDPKNQERLTLAFDDLANRQAYRLGARQLSQIQSQREATFLAYTNEATLAARNSDAATRTVLLEQGYEQIASLEAAAVITPEEAERRRQQLASDLDNAAAIGMIQDDPEGFLLAAQGGEFNGLGGETLARYEASAQAELTRQEQAAAREAERAAEEQTRQIGAQLGNLRDIFSADRPAVDEAWLDRPEVQAHPDYPRTRAALDLRNERANLPFMTVAQLDELIAEEKDRPVAHAYQAERLEVLQAQRDRAAEGWASDPIAFAQESGFDVPPLPAFDPQNPQAYLNALGQRQAFGNALVRQGYITDPRALSDEERAQLRAPANVANAPEDRLAYASAILPALRGVGIDNASNLIEDRTFLNVGNQFVTGQITREVALQAFRGQQILEEGNVVLPPRADRTEAVFQTIGGVFADLPAGERMQADAIATADAIYASRVRQSDPAGDIDEDLYRQAFHEAMGGTGAFDSQGMGGVQTLNDVPTIMPRGVNAGQVELAFRNIGVRSVQSGDFAEVGEAGYSGYLPDQIFDQSTMERRLSAISRSGQPPVIAGQIPTAADLQGRRIIAVGPDQYVMGWDQGGGFRTLHTADGEQWVFSMRALLQEVAP